MADKHGQTLLPGELEAGASLGRPGHWGSASKRKQGSTRYESHLSKRLASFATFLKLLDYFRNTHYLTLIETLAHVGSVIIFSH